MKLYLDDERVTPVGWIRSYTAQETIDLLKTKRVEELSLDHDLGDDVKIGTGYDVLVWLEETIYNDPKFPVPVMNVHSANSSAKLRMNLAILSIKRIVQMRDSEHNQ